MAIPGTQNIVDELETEIISTNPTSPTTPSILTGTNDRSKTLTLSRLKQLLLQSPEIKELNFAPGAICALVGHLSQETSAYVPSLGGNNIVNPTSDGGGLGIGQWKFTRRSDLLKFSEVNNLDPLNIDTQIRFIAHELKNGFLLVNKILKDPKSSITQKTAAAHLIYGFKPGKYIEADIRSVKTPKDGLTLYNREKGTSPNRVLLRYQAAEDCFKDWKN
jgi:hypothetical protein